MAKEAAVTIIEFAETRIKSYELDLNSHSPDNEANALQPRRQVIRFYNRLHSY
jgi:hypothetical protein